MCIDNLLLMGADRLSALADAKGVYTEEGQRGERTAVHCVHLAQLAYCSLHTPCRACANAMLCDQLLSPQVLVDQVL